MKALVYHGPGRRAWEEVPDAVIHEPTDAVVRVDAVTICGTDLHILGGDVPEVTAGRILGHEAVGTVTAVGSAVQKLVVGDRVLVSCITSCGSCRYCREGSYGQCLYGGGWILGHLIDGTQAEYVRVPFAENSTHAVPDGVTDEQMVMLADILPTAYEVGVLNSTVRPADVVAIIGAGPIGLAAIVTARLFSPSHIVAIDLVDSRLEAARKFGADIVVNSGHDDPWPVIAELTGGLGADVMAGIAERFATALDCVDTGFLGDGVLDQLPTGSTLGAARVGGVDLNKPRMRDALKAVLALAPAPNGFTVAEFAAKVHALTGVDHCGYTVRQAAYDLRKLRGKQLIDKPGRSRRYRVPPPAARTIAALLTPRDQVIAPILAAVRSPRMGRKPAHWTRVDRHYERIRVDMQTLFNDLAIETPLAA